MASRWQHDGRLVVDTHRAEPTMTFASRRDAEEAARAMNRVWDAHMVVARYIPRRNEVVDRVTGWVVTTEPTRRQARHTAVDASVIPDFFALPPREEIAADESEADSWYWIRQEWECSRAEAIAWIEDTREQAWIDWYDWARAFAAEQLRDEDGPAT